MSQPKKRLNQSYPSEYYQLVEWMSLPKGLRRPKSTKAFAETLGITRETLYQWRKREGFYDLVRASIKLNEQNHTAEVIKAVREAAITVGLRGQAANAKLWLEYVDGFIREQKLSVYDATREKRASSLLDLYKEYDGPTKDSKTAKTTRKSGNKGDKRSTKTKTSKSIKKSKG
jgi:hypothetical protein